MQVGLGQRRVRGRGHAGAKAGAENFSSVGPGVRADITSSPKVDNVLVGTYDTNNFINKQLLLTYETYRQR